MTAPKPFLPTSDEDLVVLYMAMHLRGQYRSRGINLNPRDVLSLIARIEAAEGRTVQQLLEERTGGNGDG